MQDTRCSIRTAPDEGVVAFHIQYHHFVLFLQQLSNCYESKPLVPQALDYLRQGLGRVNTVPIHMKHDNAAAFRVPKYDAGDPCRGKTGIGVT